MNKLKILVSIVIVIIFFSCKKGDAPAKPLNDLLMSGPSWTINPFTGNEIGSNTPINYTGYVLVFHTDGKIQVQSDTLSGNGTWRTYDSGDRLVLSIDLEGDDFLYLKAQWTLMSMTATRLEFTPGLPIMPTTFMTLVKN